jgi:hypothetical protein
VIFESDRTGNLELFRQHIGRREPERLTYSKRENYMAQLSPNGKWILFMSSVSNRQKGYTDLRLMRIPASGGPMIQVPIAGSWDEFRCGRFGSSNGCVLRASNAAEQIFYELDPLTGKGRELGRNGTVASGFGAWALSPDGDRVAIPDSQHAGCFTEMRLAPQPSKRWQVSRQIPGLTTIAGMSRAAWEGEWLASTPGDHAGFDFTLVPYFLDQSGYSALYFLDAHEHPFLLEKDTTSAFGVFSPDGKHVATINTELTRNLWSLDR